MYNKTTGEATSESNSIFTRFNPNSNKLSEVSGLLLAAAAPVGAATAAVDFPSAQELFDFFYG